MSKRKLGSVSWSMMFRLSPETSANTDKIWEVWRKWDKLVPTAFAEWATDDWYVWHSFSSQKQLMQALPLVFDEFEEVQEITVYKDITIGCFTDARIRKKVARPIA